MRTMRMLLFMLTAVAAYAQPQLETPRPSPRASVSQEVGVTEVSVTYFRPGVKGREIWGKLVPYDLWRTGANALPVISFQDAVTIEGRPLAAGTYGIVTIPGEKEWTVIISRDAKSSGLASYDSTEDALRVTVQPAAAEFTERMAFEFSDLTDTSAVLSLRWEKLRVPVRIGVNTREIVLERAEKDLLRGPGSFTWRSWNEAAEYAVDQGMRLDKALKWADESIGMERNFTNMTTKARILEATGKKSSADSLMSAAMPLARETDLLGYGGDLLGWKRPADAMKIFKYGMEKHPESWRMARGVARSYRDMKDLPASADAYAAALKLAPADQKEALTKEMEAAKKAP